MAIKASPATEGHRHYTEWLPPHNDPLESRLPIPEARTRTPGSNPRERPPLNLDSLMVYLSKERDAHNVGMNRKG